MNSNIFTTDFLIIGSGAAGLNAALHASQFGEVILVTKSSLKASSSYWAQGGIAAVCDANDSFESHQQDTLDAGRGYCDEQAVEIIVKEGSERVRELIDRGMAFDSSNGKLELGLEGGHSNRRVLHANGAATGKALIDFLMAQVINQPNIEIIESTFVYALMINEDGCFGAKAYCYQDEKLLTLQSPITILATGGYSRLYQRSTNPHTSTGDGLWLGYNVGAELKDLEFIQFHPTVFYAEDGTTFLISEAVRGEGARLYNEAGERFMNDHPQKELAPRDIVSQEIFRQIQEHKSQFVYLDVRHLDVDKLRNHFPSLMQRIEDQGVDITCEGIPVAPSAHYCIGGIATDLDGQTSVTGLYACGEVAATGVHGANRLASNSLLECLVFSKRAIDHAVTNDRTVTVTSVPGGFEVNKELEPLFSELQQNVSNILSKHVGIQRHKKGLEEAYDVFDQLQMNLPSSKNEYYTLRSQGMLQIAKFITMSALQREESRGVHTRTDYPELDPQSNHNTFYRERFKVLSV
ncbi:L-aspartate oxidase [Fodinibius sp. Rm-B-1B1-1]|uniref:L-aspartate oxidase n=1 Tax=Fodinibius alkaliphilus TaxID=3140241 RepID=UPI00315B3DE1